MSYYVRKISRAKWNVDAYTSLSDLAADAVTLCMRTDSNTLSIWEIESADSQQLDEIAIALATNFERVNTFRILVIDSSLLRLDQFKIEKTPGKTNFKKAEELHRTIYDLTYGKLGEIAQVICDILKEDDDTKLVSYSRNKLKTIVRDAISTGKITTDCFKDRFMEDL